MKWTDNLHQGYVRVVFSPTSARADYIAVDTVLSPDYRAFTLHTETIARNEKDISFER